MQSTSSCVGVNPKRHDLESYRKSDPHTKGSSSAHHPDTVYVARSRTVPGRFSVQVVQETDARPPRKLIMWNHGKQQPTG